MSLPARDATMCLTCPSRHRAQGLALVVGEEGERHDTSERRNIVASRVIARGRVRRWGRAPFALAVAEKDNLVDGGHGSALNNTVNTKKRSARVHSLPFAPLKPPTPPPSSKLDGDGD